MNGSLIKNYPRLMRDERTMNEIRENSMVDGWSSGWDE